ncbi:DUF7847 domain-containing protein [Streptomyces apocyni]|uniref:DUF7847 domain-containing protein n=1 Tax=Streptomyces apocyni TaxID=2654677 RepID=UPI0012EAA219|nr:hypothetical protein [Streptomyces apocyni]
MPLAPKPGVIPLAPLTVGDILGGGFSTLGHGLKPLLGMAAAIFFGAALLIAAAFGIAVLAVLDHLRTLFDLPPGTDPDSSDIFPLFGAFGGAWLASMLIFIVSVALMNAVCLVVTQDAVLGKRPTFRDVWQRAAGRIPAMLGTQLLIWLMILTPFLLLAAIPIGLALSHRDDGASVAAGMAIFLLGMLALWPLITWLYVRFSLAPAAVVFERQRPVAALRRSATLVRGVWWRTFGIQLLVMIVAGTIGYVVTMPFTYGGMFGAMAAVPGNSSLSQATGPLVLGSSLYLLGMAVSQFITTVLPQLSIGLMYVDRRIRTENLAPTLAEAAGVPSPPPPYPGQPYPG